MLPPIKHPISLGHNTSLRATAFPLADANGNCVTYVDNAGNVQAHYTYDAFGNTISSTGDMDDDFRFRFSSKYLDDETGFYYYGYRYDCPALGRWLSRDPIGERGGLLLYGFVGNNGINRWDRLGLYGTAYEAWAKDLMKESCCGGKPIDLSTHCCIDDKHYSKEKKPTGIKRCCAYSERALSMNIQIGDYTSIAGKNTRNTTIHLYGPDHCWLQYPIGNGGIGARGFYPGGVVDEFAKANPYPSRKYADKPFGGGQWIECEEFVASECDYDLASISDCMAKSKTVLPFSGGGNDCRHFSAIAYKHCVMQGARGFKKIKNSDPLFYFGLPLLNVSVLTLTYWSAAGDHVITGA